MADKILENLIKAETKRQKETIDLIPSENIASQAVLKALCSALVNKYSEGYPGRRYYAGNKIIDQIEIITQQRALKLLHLNKNRRVNVQPYSGSPANLAIYNALLRPGDKIMAMDLFSGGHLTHGSKANFSGKFYKVVHYGVTKNGYLDYDEILKLAKNEKPKIIVCGATAYPRIIDFKKFGVIAKKISAYLLADISHIAGLVASRAHPSPFPYADVVMTTTQKTLRGPRGALIFSKKNIAPAIDKAVFPGLQGGPHDNQTAAIAACLNEALQPDFKKYGEQIVKNAKALAHELQKLNFKLISGGTDNHLMLIDLKTLRISGHEAQNKLEEAGIIVNRNTIPFETRSAYDPSGIRLGTPAMTTRGMKEKEMKKIAELIYRILVKKEDLKSIKKEVKILAKRFKVHG